MKPRGKSTTTARKFSVKAKAKALKGKKVNAKSKAKAKAKGRAVRATKSRKSMSNRTCTKEASRVRAKIPRTKDELARIQAQADRQSGAHGRIRRRVTVSSGPARGWRVSGILVDDTSVAKKKNKMYDTKVRWRFESPRRSRVFKVWKSAKANVPSLADAVSEGAFEQIKRAVRPEVLRKLKVKRAAVVFRDSQTYKRQRSGVDPPQSGLLDVPIHDEGGMNVGEMVTIVNLHKRPELNGLTGKLLHHIVERDRWAVSLSDHENNSDEAGTVINVKPVNLVLSTSMASATASDASHGQNADMEAVAAQNGPIAPAEATDIATPQQKRVHMSPSTWNCNCLKHLRRMPYCVGYGPSVVHLQSKITRVGRGVGNDVSLQSSKTPQMLSRNHAVIRQESAALFLVDQGSLNGVLLNGIRVYGEQLLRPGDVVTFGVVTPEPEFDYILEERPVPRPS
jgi:hypothetical protein